MQALKTTDGLCSAQMSKTTTKEQPEYGKHLASLRKKAGLTQKELAEKTNVRQSNITFWEYADKPPRGEVIHLLAQALGVSLEVLLNVEVLDEKKHRGPQSRLDKVVNKLNALPRRKQERITDVLEALVAQESV